MKLLCYGTVAGGFLSGRWLGAPEPLEPQANRSLVKYKLIIDDFGGWPLFQDLLATLKAAALKHAVSITAVATRWVLDRPGVAGAIIGARYAEHLPDNLNVFRFALDDDDRAAIARVLARRTGPRVNPMPSSVTAKDGTDASCTTTSTRPEPWPAPIIPSPGRPCGWSICTPSSRRGSAGRRRTPMRNSPGSTPSWPKASPWYRRTDAG